MTVAPANQLRQADRPCTNCGSWYRRGDYCNRCGFLQPVPESFYTGPDTKFSLLGRPPKGRQWDSKKHKYVS